MIVETFVYGHHVLAPCSCSSLSFSFPPGNGKTWMWLFALGRFPLGFGILSKCQEVQGPVFAAHRHVPQIHTNLIDGRSSRCGDVSAPTVQLTSFHVGTAYV